MQLRASLDGLVPRRRCGPWPTTYPAIADHGLIGDQQTCALVTTDGTIDWFCCPRFDSPSVFASLLDQREGRPVLHQPRTADLRHEAALLPGHRRADHPVHVAGGRRRDPRLHADRQSVGSRPIAIDRAHGAGAARRGAPPIRGRAALRLRAREHTLRSRPSTAPCSTSGKTSLTLHSSVPLEARENDVVGEFTLRAGDVGGFILESASDDATASRRRRRARRLLPRDGRNAWRSWLHGSTYRGRWRDMVNRAAITLKLLTYAPTGAPVAAATTGLPEQVGGERNWDYRYTWLRDASFTVQALDRLGFKSTTRSRFLTWLRDRVEEHQAERQRPAADHVPRRRQRRSRGVHARQLRGLPRIRRRCGSATRRRNSSSSTRTAR